MLFVIATNSDINSFALVSPSRLPIRYMTYRAMRTSKAPSSNAPRDIWIACLTVIVRTTSFATFAPGAAGVVGLGSTLPCGVVGTGWGVAVVGVVCLFCGTDCTTFPGAGTVLVVGGGDLGAWGVGTGVTGAPGAGCVGAVGITGPVVTGGTVTGGITGSGGVFTVTDGTQTERTGVVSQLSACAGAAKPMAKIPIAIAAMNFFI